MEPRESTKFPVFRISPLLYEGFDKWPLTKAPINNTVRNLYARYFP